MAKAVVGKASVEALVRDAKPRPLVWRGFASTLTVSRMRKRLRTGEEKVYVGYRLTVPQEVVEELGLSQGDDLGVLVARLRWYHLMNYWDRDVREKLWPHLPLYAKAEICMLGLAPETLCQNLHIILVVASREELERLGLQPGQTITLRELLAKTQKV